jgi:hypothetical protein
VSGKSIPFSVRLSPDDAVFLAGLDVEGAASPSDKLRALIAEARKRHEGVQDYQDCHAFLAELAAPCMRFRRALELEAGSQSEWLGPMADWLVEALAYYLSHVAPLSGDGTGRKPDIPAGRYLAAVEAGLADRALRLTERLLRLGVTSSGPFHDPALLRGRLQPVLELCRVIEQTAAATGKGEVQ